MSNDTQDAPKGDRPVAKADSPSPDTRSTEVQIEELRLKKLSLKLDFGKFLLGSVIVVLITAGLNYSISTRQSQLADKQKTQELELDKLQKDRTFLSDFIQQAMDENLEKRIRFAHYFSRLTDETDEDEKEVQGDRWDAYYRDLLATATSIVVEATQAPSKW